MKQLTTIVLFILTTNSYAQTKKINISQLAFMSGNWTQDHEWGKMEESWSEPMGNCMMSAFRCVKDGQVKFYEFVVIEQSDSVPVLKMRHFSPGNIGWEDKQTPIGFPLKQLDKNKVLFISGDQSLKMTYEVVPKKTMMITLEEKEKTGNWTTTVFHFTYNQ